MSDLVERVARAMANDDALGSEDIWPLLSPVEKSVWMRLARAAIRIMLETAARKCNDIYGSDDGDGTFNEACDKCADAILAMIPKDGK